MLLGCDGTKVAMEARRKFSTREPTEEEWRSGLTAMREYQRSSTDARVLLGGRVAEFNGRMPALAEGALVSLHAGQPVFLIGGFGGCTRDIAETIGLVETVGRVAERMAASAGVRAMDGPGSQQRIVR